MRKLSILVGGIVAVLVALAGAGKLLDWPVHVQSVSEWQLLPAAGKAIAAYVVPPLELLVGIAWFNRKARPLCELLLVGLLAAVLAVVAVHWAHNVRPHCNCYGRIMEWLANGERYRVAIWPSALLLAGALFGAILPRLLRYEKPQIASSDPPRAERNTGFTIVELLIVLLIVTILSALAFPALRGGRQAARIAALHTNLRSAANIAVVYAADWRDQLPFYFGQRTDERARPLWACTVAAPSLGLLEELPSPFAGGGLWHVGLAEYAFDSRPSPSAVSDPRSPANDPRVLLYSCSLMTHAAYWNPKTREGANQFVPSRLSEASFASKKCAFMSDYSFLYLLDGRPRGFVSPQPVVCELSFLDGHAASVQPESLRPGVISGDGSAVPGWGAHNPDRLAGLHTDGGVRGRDVN